MTAWGVLGFIWLQVQAVRWLKADFADSHSQCHAWREMNRLPAIALDRLRDTVRVLEKDTCAAHETLDLGTARCAMVNVWNESHPELSASLWVNERISASNINMRVVSSRGGTDEEPA